MIDVHCHLNFHAYAKDYDECIQRAKEKGVSKIINVGTKIDSSEKAVELANKYDNLYAIVGIHPHHADKVELGITNNAIKTNEKRREDENFSSTQDLLRRSGESEISELRSQENFASDQAGSNSNIDTWLKQLEHLARQPKVVAIGEIGLDYYRYQSNGITDIPLQKEIFEAQLVLAHALGLPIQIHNRHAGKDILEMLMHHKNILRSDFPGMFHCFAGSPEILKKALDLGFMIGFDGNSTYAGLAPGETTSLPDLARLTPIDRILTETDSPFLTPLPHRGTRNEPSYVILVGEFLAKMKAISFEDFDYQTEQNAKKLFSI